MNNPVDENLALPKGFKPNPGHIPKGAAGKRVRVILRNPHGQGPYEPAYADANTQAVPTGWAADERGGCRWSLTGHAFDIVGYRIL